MELPRRVRGDELLKAGELADRAPTSARTWRARTIWLSCDRLRGSITAHGCFRSSMPICIWSPLGCGRSGRRCSTRGSTRHASCCSSGIRISSPSQMKLDGRIPDLFMVSSMQIHSTRCKELIRDACKIDPAYRPLILVGGPKTVYEPWDVFSADPNDPWGADVAVTGEEYRAAEPDGAVCYPFGRATRRCETRSSGRAIAGCWMRSPVWFTRS